MQVTVIGPDRINLLLAVPPGLFDGGFRPDPSRAYLADPANIPLLAFDGPLAVGMATVMRHPDKGNLFVNELGTRVSHPRQGIATAIMQHLFTIGRAKGSEAAWLGTETDNTPARALRKLGGTAETFVGFDWDRTP